MSLGEYICLGVDVCLLTVAYKLYRNNKKNLQAIKDAPYLEIGNTLKNAVNETATKCIPYAVIRGTVRAIDRPIISKNVPHMIGVIQENILREHQVRWSWAARWWTDVTRDITRSTNSVPFALMGQHGVIGVEIAEPLEAIGLELVTVHDVFKPTTVSAWEVISSFFRGEMSKGLQDIEKMLPEGAVLTGVGALVLTREQQVQMRPPGDGLSYFLTQMTDDAIVKQLKASASFYWFVAAILGSIGSVLLGKILLGHYWDSRESAARSEDIRRLTDVQLERLRARREAASSRPDASAEDADDTQLCRVCYINPREVVLLECGHVCCCVDCSLALNPAVCPVCRSPIERILPAYVS